jgi:AAA+ ATPase superfamily predicted ATPase
MQITGRRAEQDALRKYAESKRPEFVAVYGQRRVGKTPHATPGAATPTGTP